jgi:hypothetical protein
MGGSVAWAALLQLWNSAFGYQPFGPQLPLGVVLLQPAIGRTSAPDGLLDAVRVVVVNGPHAGQKRWQPDLPYVKDASIRGSTHIWTSECIGANYNHCSHPQFQALAVSITS